MRTLAATIIALTFLAAAQDELPPGHPPVTTRPASPALPPGHPPLPDAPPAPAPPMIAVNGELSEIADIIAAYYASISGPAGMPRNWDRFESLFLPGARLVTVMPNRVLEMTPADFAAANRAYFERGGYFEEQLVDRIVTFGSVAHVWSTYEARRRTNGPVYSRGLNSFQLVASEGRWWITGVAWDRERAGVAIPAEYLPAAEGAGTHEAE